MEMEHPKAPELRNKDRKANDLKNYERALRCFAAGINGGNDDLSAVAQERLVVSDFVLGRTVEEGVARLNVRKTRPTSEKTIKNLIACCKAVQAVVRSTDRVISKSAFRTMRDKPKRKYRKPFPQELWPESLRRDFEGYAAWKMKAILSPEEGEHLRPTVCRPISIKAHVLRLNQYVGYLVRERGLDNLTLVDLCQPGLYADFLNWYLECDATGGYVNARSTGTTLGTISQYLVATGRLSQKSATGKDIWDEFYSCLADIQRFEKRCAGP
jgi:ketosteroid isomerase-like protein